MEKTMDRDSGTDVIVIGGGAAGMLCAGTAAERGKSVLLLEKNEKLGRKLNITGKGRCNLTNHCPWEEVLRNIPGNPRFLYSAMGAFPPDAVMEFFEKEGLPLKTERGNRVFPQSDSAFHVTDTLRGYCRRTGVRIRTETVTGLWMDQDGTLRGVITDKGRRASACVVLATGGLSYPGTGSTGDGYRFAAGAGHTIVPPRASLVPLVARESFCGELQGLSLRNVTLRAYEEGNKKPLYEELGEMLFTHFGVSGPLVLSASAHLRELGKRDYRLSIDLKPALAADKLDRRLLRDLEEQNGKQIGNALGGLLPRRMIPVLLRLSEVSPAIRVSELSRKQRQCLVERMKDLPIHISDARPVSEAIITSGGVSTKEIDPKTMASKLVPGLYFAGEVIDVDGYTGGYNLQIAWATARAAGRAV